MLKRLISVPFFFVLAFSSHLSFSQCTNANVNWDNLDFISTQSNANYATYINTPALVANMVQTQRFAIGTNRVVFTTNYPSSGILGENTTHTGESGSFGTGADASFTGNGTITFTFDTAVSNLQLSIYDLDASQSVTVTAFEGVTPRVVTLTKPSGGNVIIAGNIGTGAASSQANNVNVATLNIAVAGPLTSLTLVFGGTAGNFWISDMQACVYRGFLTNYYTISQPFTGQPAYVLVVHDLNTIFMLDPATGRAVSLFTDSDPRVREINNLAYDPYKKIIYYSVDGLERCTPPGTPDSIRHIKKYDLNTETISTLISDVKTSPFYMPTYNSGLESGGACFYNGSLFMGVEAYFLSGTRNSARETAIWRIDFGSDSLTPVSTSQVWATPVDNGTNNIHDYADFVMKDGTLYTYNSSTSLGNGRYSHVDMQTNVTTTTVVPGSSANIPKQAAQSWNGTVYWVANEIGVYNGTVSNTVTGKQTIFSAPRSTSWVGPAGDAAEAFRPKADFGDAPSTYDPVALSPALNEKDTAIRIGATYDWEWSKSTSTDASGDGADEDGLAYVPVFDPGSGNYLVQVQVYNNTGTNATLCAWFDYNGNGVFDASEAVSPITVSTSSGMQSFYLYWPSISSPITNGSYTYLRIRLTSATNGMTTASATGYFNDGETEDYRVLVDDYPLSANLLSFNAKAVNNSTARLNWLTTAEENLSGYQIERSPDGLSWSAIGFVKAKGNHRSEENNYLLNDLQALKGKSFYRLKIIDNGDLYHYSESRSITIKDQIEQVSLIPNPARSTVTVYMSSDRRSEAQVIIYDAMGRKIRTEKFSLAEGGNSLHLNNLDKIPEGTYIVQIISGQSRVSQKLIINR
ncbi:MAG: T9SS type A sorting domain-containing protein [Sphingobacteriales bacterium]|nr:T9SS type A sorting domain-containing protein [Sphingobacteriales bacterium]